MARRWVLDTETKGTGAEMVPLDKVQERRRSSRPEEEPRRRYRARRRARPEPEPQPRRPRRFKVVDVMTRETVVEDVGARAALDALGDARSVVDVIVYAWDRERDDWRPLTLREQKVLWAERPG